MKKNKVFIIFIILWVGAYSFSQSMSLIPNDVYLGDTAEIRFTFPWNGNIFTDDVDSFNKIKFSELDKTLSDNYTIKTMELFKTAEGYTLSLIFSPWKTGQLDIEPIDIATVFDLKVDSLIIDVPEIDIQSIFSAVEKKKEIRPPVGPIVIPGTSYIIVLFTVIIIVTLLLLIMLFVRFESTKNAIVYIFSRLLISGNMKRATKRIAFLLKNVQTLPLEYFASELSQIIRIYLEKRFSHPFTAETTSNFPHVFEDLLMRNQSQDAKLALSSLFEICTLCDFLHYAGSETEKKAITEDEKKDLLQITKSSFTLLEKVSVNQKEKDGGTYV